MRFNYDIWKEERRIERIRAKYGYNWRAILRSDKYVDHRKSEPALKENFGKIITIRHEPRREFFDNSIKTRAYKITKGQLKNRSVNVA